MDNKNIESLINQYRNVPESKLNKKITGDDPMARFVCERFYNMSLPKYYTTQVWEGVQKLYYVNDMEWIVSGEGFDKPVRFPTLRDFIKTLVDTFMQDPPKAMLKARKKDEESLVLGKKAYIEERLESIHEKSVRRQVIEDMFFYGKGLREVGYECIEREVNGKTIQLFDDVATKRIDPRNFFVDEMANKLHSDLRVDCARDVIIRRELPLSTYKKMSAANGFTEIEVTTSNFYETQNGNSKPTNTMEIQEKSPNNYVIMYEYMNQEEDIYAVVVCGQTVFQSTLTKAKGTTRIPVSDYNFEPRNDSFWGLCVAQLIAPHIYLKDTLFQLEIMNLKLTLQPVVAISGDFGFNKDIHVVQPGGVWEAAGFDNGKISDKITPVITGNPQTNVYGMMQMIDGELSVTSRTDLRTLQFNKQKTATEVVAQDRSANAHNETIETIAEIESEGFLMKIICEIMQSFMEADDKKKKKHRVKIKDYMVVKNEDGYAGFKSEPGYEDFFELTEDMINVEADIEVVDRRSEVAKNVEKVGRMMQALPLIANIAQLDPNVLERVDFFGMLEQLVEAIGMDMGRAFKDSPEKYEDMYNSAKEEILLGHEVAVPEDETRRESLSRLKYFSSVKSKYWDKLSSKAQRALTLHLSDTLNNIVANQIEKKQMIEEKEAIALSSQMATPPAQGGQQQVKQPDSSLLAASTTSPNKNL